MKRKSIVILGIIGFVMLTGCSEDDKKKQSAWNNTKIQIEQDKTTTDSVEEERVTESVAEEAPTDNSEEKKRLYSYVDYAVFAKYLTYNTHVEAGYRDATDITGCELVDSDQDGYPELYVNKIYNEYKNISYIISPYTNPGICMECYSGPSGESQILFSETEQKPYLYCEYSTVMHTGIDYSTIENNVMVPQAHYLREGDVSTPDELAQETTSWKGEEQSNTYQSVLNNSIYQAWKEKVDTLNFRPLRNSFDDICKVTTNDDFETACKGLEGHIVEVGATYEMLSADLDRDGADERLYITRNYIDSWLSNINNISNTTDDVFCTVVPGGSVYFVVDANETGTDICSDIMDDISNVQSISYDKGIIKIIDFDDSCREYNALNKEGMWNLYWDYSIPRPDEDTLNQDYIEGGIGSTTESTIDQDEYGHGLYVFYGIWAYASKDLESAQEFADSVEENGYRAILVLTSEWSGLNPEPYYAVSVGFYDTYEEAEAALPEIQKIYTNAYIKYAGCNDSGI